MIPLRDVSNTRFREMVHYCEACNYRLINLGSPSVTFGIGTKTAGSVTVTHSHSGKFAKKRDLRSADYLASYVNRTG